MSTNQILIQNISLEPEIGLSVEDIDEYQGMGYGGVIVLLRTETLMKRRRDAVTGRIFRNSYVFFGRSQTVTFIIHDNDNIFFHSYKKMRMTLRKVAVF